MLGVAAAAVWYSQQDPHTQERAQLHVLEGLNWLIERDETDPQADAVLRWIVEQLPGSAGGEVAVDAIESLDRFTFAGIPDGAPGIRLLENEGYLVGFDESYKNPAWVAYRLKYVAGASTAKRPHGFDTDHRTQAQISHGDYTHSGYDRGHMAPNYGIGRMYGASAQVETFLMSNIVPQQPELNRGPWKELEQLIANDYLEQFGEVWVITGPIYRQPDSDRLQSYLTSVDAIEAQTGLDFFNRLADADEARLESARARFVW